MGKKAKTGKSRKDKFYHLAKETGYRARSAFKLLQLNRKFEFLQKSRVCVDLCAAPGGWLQVAAQHMPISSIIIGVDLVPIKPIPNTVTFAEDITTEKCKQTIKKELQTWKADVFLNDGAPNVGKNWIHDAFQQAELTLAALKLATAFLKKNGWFVTKVFRSKDYQALMWVFRQMFKHVHATKPQASRNESAEIFVVCQGFLAPDTIDPKFLDPKFVFKDVGAEPKSLLNLVHPEKRNKKAHGYAEGDYTLHHRATVTQFITSSDYLELLAEVHVFTFDNETIEKHELTTAEIKECCKDIKVLGKKELRSLLSWRKKMKEMLEKIEKDEEDEELESADKEIEGKDGKDGESGTDSDEEKLEQQLEDLKDEQRKDLKKKRKKVMKEKRKLRDKMSLGMVIPGDRIEITDDVNLFNLKGIKRKQDLKAVSQKGMEEAVSDDDEDLDELEPKNKKLMMAYDRYGDQPQDDAFPSDDEDAGSEELDQSDAEEDDLEMESGDESEEEKEENPLVVQMESKDARTQKKLDMWFNKDAFTGLEDEKDEDLEIEKMVADYKERGGTVIGKDIQKESEDSGNASEDSDEENDAGAPPSEEEGSESSDDNDSEDSDDSDDSDDDDDDDFDFSTIKAKRRSEDQIQTDKKSKKSGFEEVPASAPGGRVAKLDPIGLAIGAEMIKSSKRRRDIVEMSYNRYTSNDSNLPDWFAKDESKHCKKQMPVTKDQVQEYKAKSRAINARPIKKIAEAKARKKRKSIKKLEKARKKADAVSDTVDVTDKEKWKAIKDIYKRAGLLKKKKENTTYVVAKKGGGQKVRRPAGVKGRYKVVDPRMKKDMRAMKNEQKNQKGAKGGRQRSGGRGKKR